MDVVGASDSSGNGAWAVILLDAHGVFVLPDHHRGLSRPAAHHPSGGGRFISTSTASSPMPRSGRVWWTARWTISRVLAATSMACLDPVASTVREELGRHAPRPELTGTFVSKFCSSPPRCWSTVELVQHSCTASPEHRPAEWGAFGVVQERPGKLQLRGELDLAGVTEVWARLAGVSGDVELNGAGLTFIDASGLKLFVAVQARCRARGARLSIVNPSRCVIRLVDLTGLAATLDVRTDSSAA